MTGLGPLEPIKIKMGYSRLKWVQKSGHFVLIWKFKEPKSEGWLACCAQ
jgi:hypothetical protein